MSLSFSEEGPIFPSALIDAMLAGEVAFLCGSGVSAPQLSTFKQLVDKVFIALGAEKNASEELAYTGERFEEVLGSLTRRMAKPMAVLHATNAILALPETPDLDQHRTVLRLSRDLSNRVMVVSTNFDTLAERALLSLDANVDIAGESFAGQALPAPGSAEFGGIIHLHGRLADPALGLEETPLVLTSVDYGDAYMRGGWASRFLFDLARCKTIVLLGYSAGDAPVRYFLNVLEADRARFPDLKPVYAFAEYEDDRSAAETPWGTVAVIPIAYSKINPATGEPDHSPLWQDLAQLADIIERPTYHREQRLTAILARPSSDIDDLTLAELRWLTSGGFNPWRLAIETINDPRWFKVFSDNELWTRHDAEWAIPGWIALHWESRECFLTAIEWQVRLDGSFNDQLEYSVGRAKMAPGWRKAWRLFCTARPEDDRELDSKAYVERLKLGSGLVLAQDLERAVQLLSPILVLGHHYSRSLSDETESDQASDDAQQGEPSRLSDLARVEFGRDNHRAAAELIDALVALDDRARPILELATAALQAALAQMVDLDLIRGDFDETDYMVPSVESHRQNEYHSGVLPLVQLIVATFAIVAAKDVEVALQVASRWADFPGRIGPRLLLHAMRNNSVFSGDDAMGFLLDLDLDRFWMIRREIAMLLLDRAPDANPVLTAKVERRIRETGDSFYERYGIEEGQTDWRPSARDKDVWLRLSQLASSGVLTAAGEAELAAISERRPNLDRGVEDQDFFSVYSYGVRQVTGDAEAITATAPEDRLAIVQEQITSPDIEQQHGWGAFCRDDPKGAFATLADAEFTSVNLDLWSTLLSALNFGDDQNKPLREDLAVDALARLAGVGSDLLPRIAADIVDTFRFGPRGRIADREDWYDRLWAALGDGEAGTDAKDLANAALNRPVGRLALVLREEHQASRDAGDGDIERQRARLRVIARDQRPAAIYARAIFVQFISFFAEADPALVSDELMPRIASEDEGAALRAILVTYSAITPLVSRTMAAIILQAVREVKIDSRGGHAAAAAMLRPALAELREDTSHQWGIAIGDVRSALRDVSAGVRKAALDLLYRWGRADEAGPAHGWQTMARPFLGEVWPQERRFVDAANNEILADLALGAEEHFPEALDLLRYFIVPGGDRRINLTSMMSMPAVGRFPRHTLDLVWLLFGPEGRVSHVVPDFLAKLIEADPAIEVDRRLQSLLQRAERF